MAFYLKIIQYAETSKNSIVYKYPLPKNGKEVNEKSKLIVKEGQSAIFVHKGQLADVFGPGTYDLNTGIFPILSRLAGWKYGFQTPIELQIYFVNMTQFTSNKWGTANPILMRDPEFGVVRVQGFGSYSFKVDDPSVFLRELLGTKESYNTQDITDWLRSMVVSALTDVIGESKVSVLDLAGNTTELNEIVTANIQIKFNEIGLKLVNLFIENMSVPQEVEKAIDERSKLGVLGDKTDVMMKIAAAEAMKDAAKNPGVGGTFMGAGVGLGAGAGIGAAFANAFNSANQPQQQTPAAQPTAPAGGKKKCPKCGAEISASAKFCPECGEKIPAKRFCPECGAEVSATAKFCPECGNKIS